jgi:dipeptidyl aminopeptidase/acylaminoacyl peptidase
VPSPRRTAAVAILALFAIRPAAANPDPPCDPPLIPRQILFGNPDRAWPQISPDGAKLAYLAPVEGLMNVLVAYRDEPLRATPVTHDRKRGIRQYYWAFSNRHLVYLQDDAGDENWHVFVADIETGVTKDVTPLKDVQARIQEISPKFPTEILVALNDRDPRVHDIYRVNLLTCERTLVILNDRDFVGFVTDPDFNVRFATLVTASGDEELHRYVSANRTWEPFARIPMEDAQTTEVVGFDRTGGVLYLKDCRGRDTTAMTAIDLATGAQTVLAEDARCDVAGVLIHPSQRTVQAVAFDFDRRSWKFLDAAAEADFDALRAACPGDPTVINRSFDDSQWIVSFERDDGPAAFVRYDRNERKTHHLFTNRSRLEGLTLARMQPVVIPARDGLKLVSYLSVPPHLAEHETGRPSKPLPMVLLVHGGPWARDAWGLQPQHQWLTNRGLAVLSVNFRGSTGFGKKFLNAGNREWAGKMHNDLLDAVEWAVDQRIADPRRIGIMGGSYGGYAALVGLSFSPATFACGVAIVGPSNLVTLLESIPPYWQPVLESFVSRVGDHRTEQGRKFLLSRSPLSRVERIRRPLLIGQGANDPRVKQSESDQIVKAMRERKIPVTYALFPDEGHGFGRPVNRLAFYAVAEEFLALHLGARCEPYGKDLQGSSVTVPNGLQYLPQLKQTLGSP